MGALVQISDLEEGYLLSVDWYQSKIYAAFEVLASDGNKYRIDAMAADDSIVEIQFSPMSLKAGLSTPDGFPCLGEIESVGHFSQGILLEGDFGAITVTASRIELESIR
ncbi:hypothetical protein [Undibacterium sp.]|jgi:hypothetical protein|uniref:hypothetical protein n=1 Tax=Undibacterium sp. TaxID=1914977 RepID=UPI002BB512DD|nr:hypothetical protein [Undibacterium sp.]HTD03658.1 hypothetical protein [Undibacterium sp.]